MTLKTRFVVLMCYPTGDTGEYEYFDTQEEGMVRFEEMEKELEEDFTSEDNIYITFYQEEGDVDTTTPETGRSSRCTTPRNTFPGLLYFWRTHDFASSKRERSKLLSGTTGICKDMCARLKLLSYGTNAHDSS